MAQRRQRQAARQPEVQRSGDSVLPDDQESFNLPLRQAMRMMQSLFKLTGLDWQVPDFSTVSRARNIWP